MALARVKGNEFLLVLSKDEFEGLGLQTDKFYEISKAKPNIWLMTFDEDKDKTIKNFELDKKIFSLLEKKTLQERVEKRFEKFLNKDELKRFQELLKEGKIKLFRLSPKYKRAIYKAAEHMPEEKASNKNLSLEYDGFAIFDDEQTAKEISQKFFFDFKEGRIFGIKSFDGKYYVIKKTVYDRYANKLLGIIKETHPIMLDTLAASANLSQTLTKIICEFLKEKGELAEVRPNKFVFIE